jgi:hypothetical protein
MPSHYFELAQDFIWRSARLIDRHLFAYLFSEGPKAPVVAALKAYQNPDGGFGNALEPDKRTPASQPIDAEEALKYLYAVDMLGDPAVHAEILRPLCDWLQTIAHSEGGVPFILPSANSYPHTPWMGADDNPPAALNPTASITGYLLKSGLRHSWIERAEIYCWQGIEKSADHGYHTVMPEAVFLQNASDHPRAVPLLNRLIEEVRQPGVVELDPNAGGYVHPPLHWASLPSSPFRSIFTHATLQLHLAALVNAQRPDGGWPISWDAVSPAAEAEWRGKLTVDTLATLRAYQQEGFEI